MRKTVEWNATKKKETQTPILFFFGYTDIVNDKKWVIINLSFMYEIKERYFKISRIRVTYDYIRCIQ